MKSVLNTQQEYNAPRVDMVAPTSFPLAVVDPGVEIYLQALSLCDASKDDKFFEHLGALHDIPCWDSFIIQSRGLCPISVEGYTYELC
jgi:hypothetical protein